MKSETTYPDHVVPPPPPPGMSQTLKDNANVFLGDTTRRKVILHDDYDTPVSKLFDFDFTDSDSPILQIHNLDELHRLIRELFSRMCCINDHMVAANHSLDILPKDGHVLTYMNQRHYDMTLQDLIRTKLDKVTPELAISIINQMISIGMYLSQVGCSHLGIDLSEFLCMIEYDKTDGLGYVSYVENDWKIKEIMISLSDFETSIFPEIRSEYNNIELATGHIKNWGYHPPKPQNSEDAANPEYWRAYDAYSLGMSVGIFIQSLSAQTIQAIEGLKMEIPDMLSFDWRERTSCHDILVRRGCTPLPAVFLPPTQVIASLGSIVVNDDANAEQKAAGKIILDAVTGSSHLSANELTQPILMETLRFMSYKPHQTTPGIRLM